MSTIKDKIAEKISGIEEIKVIDSRKLMIDTFEEAGDMYESLTFRQGRGFSIIAAGKLSDLIQVNVVSRDGDDINDLNAYDQSGERYAIVSLA